MSISHFIKHFINIRMTFQFFHINGKFAERREKKKKKQNETTRLFRNGPIHTQRT